MTEVPRARRRHRRRPPGRGAEGHRARRGGAGRRDRDPGLLLRAAPRAARRRVPHVPRRDRGDAEAPGRLHADRHRRDGRSTRPRRPRRRREGQEATLEFILVNHPLDCPVCDKGGECPLQDLTFRYGPGNTRMTFAKLTFDKPIPVSPLIALDRERCILCYRCTRFSEDVAEDGQLIARNRGARTEIATFEDEPYRSPFSGNVVELCPVGALTSTLYRFEARPWDIQNVPTVCTACPVGCNVSATIREGKVKRILSPQPPGDRPRLALRQGALHVPASPRRGPDHDAAAPRHEGARGDRLGRSARRRRGDAARGRRRRS